MSIYHLSAKIIGKSSGRSAVQMSAYISGQEQRSTVTGEVYDHTSKEEVVFNDCFFSERVPEAWRNQEIIWNEVEKKESSKNSQLARAFDIALPVELNDDERLDVVRDFANYLMNEQRYPFVQVAIHDNESNPHMHVLTPLRDLDENGSWMAKEKKIYALDDKGEKIPILNRDGTQKTDSHNRKQWKRETVKCNSWNSREHLSDIRQAWQDVANQHLEPEMQIDCRSNADRGINREAQIHLTHFDTEQMKLGIKTPNVLVNEQIKSRNEMRNIMEDLSDGFTNTINRIDRATDKSRTESVRFDEREQSVISREPFPTESNRPIRTKRGFANSAVRELVIQVANGIDEFKYQVGQFCRAIDEDIKRIERLRQPEPEPLTPYQQRVLDKINAQIEAEQRKYNRSYYDDMDR